jgi:hypothetical protein
MVKQCTTEHEPGRHRLIVDDRILAECKTEVGLFRVASRLGFRFDRMTYSALPLPPGDNRFRARTEWRG